MKLEVLTIILLFIIGLFCLFFVMGSVLYDKKLMPQKLFVGNKNNDWLFSGFQEKLYDFCYKNPTSEKICGVDVKKYERYCKLLKLPCDVKNIVSLKIEGCVLFFFCLILSYVASYNIIAVSILWLIGFAFFYFMGIKPLQNIEKKAEEKLFHVTDDLPRYLSLLEKAMDLPVDQAMMVTALKFDSPLSEDILDSINKISLGADGWQDTLISLAKTYDIVEFSDLILEIVNAYEQGVNIRQIIDRKAYEIEQSRLYAVEAHDSKTKTMIFLPIMLLKIVPLMALICMPMISEFAF